MKKGKLFGIIALVIIMCAVVSTSCATLADLLYDKYEPVSWEGRPWAEELVTLKDGEKPEITITRNEFSDNNINPYGFVTSDYYISIGYTDFYTNYNVDDQLTEIIEKQCRQNGATVARCTWYYSGGTFLKTDPYGKTATYQSTTCHYTVVYYVKTTWRDKFGWLVYDLSESQRTRFQRNTGMMVSRVFDNSPVFYANIMSNDIIIRINEHIINNRDNFEEIADSFNTGDEIEVEFIRRTMPQQGVAGSNEVITTTVKLQ